jgi:hypothetical protein
LVAFAEHPEVGVLEAIVVLEVTRQSIIKVWIAERLDRAA